MNNMFSSDIYKRWLKKAPILYVDQGGLLTTKLVDSDTGFPAWMTAHKIASLVLTMNLRFSIWNKQVPSRNAQFAHRKLETSRSATTFIYFIISGL